MEADPGRLSALHGAELYSGGDLEQAFFESARGLQTNDAGDSRFKTPGVHGLYDRLLSAQWSGLWPRSCIVRGTETLSGSGMRILFRGRLLGVDFVARHVLGAQEFERIPAKLREPHDIVVELSGSASTDRHAPPAMQVPAWVRQSRALGRSWAETLRAMPNGVRKRIARQLRSGAYTVRIDSGEAAKYAFYQDLYRPSAIARFGREAYTLNRLAFLRHARDSAVLELRSAGALVGGTLLSSRPSTLSIGKAGFSQDGGSHSLSDLLDYFCFIAAHLLGCTALDFGLSRPHIEDGVLLNKAKWGTRLGSAGESTKSIRITPVNHSDATLAFLSRNGFIERRHGRFIVRRLHSNASGCAYNAPQSAKLVSKSGLEALIIAHADACSPPAAHTQLMPAPEIIRLAPGVDSVTGFLTQT